MDTNTVPETSLEKGKIHSGNDYTELLNKMITYDEELFQLLNEIVLLGVELKKEKLENAKLEQELLETSNELDHLYMEMQSYWHVVEADEKKLNTNEEDCSQQVIQKDVEQKIVVDDNIAVD